MSWIPLLSSRALSDFTAEEYKNYVKSLYFKKQKKTPVIRIKKKKAEIEWGLTKKGNISLKIRREPKWITSDELERMIAELSVTREVVMRKLKKIEVRYE
jgi:hypothetical protein